MARRLGSRTYSEWDKRVCDRSVDRRSIVESHLDSSFDLRPFYTETDSGRIIRFDFSIDGNLAAVSSHSIDDRVQEVRCLRFRDGRDSRCDWWQASRLHPGGTRSEIGTKRHVKTHVYSSNRHPIH